MSDRHLSGGQALCLPIVGPLSSPNPFPYPLQATCFNTHAGLMSRDREGQQRKPVQKASTRVPHQ